MAATNRLDGLDDALLREGRFDLKIRIDLPDESERLRILEARLRKKPSLRFDLREFARLTPSASPAKLAALIDQAATYAFADNRKITPADLHRALNEGGGKDRPQLERVEWDQVVIDESVKQDIQSLIRLLENGAKTREMGFGSSERVAPARSARDRQKLNCPLNCEPDTEKLLSDQRGKRSR
jgi:hypothetical protein